MIIYFFQMMIFCIGLISLVAMNQFEIAFTFSDILIFLTPKGGGGHQFL